MKRRFTSPFLHGPDKVLPVPSVVSTSPRSFLVSPSSVPVFPLPFHKYFPNTTRKMFKSHMSPITHFSGCLLRTRWPDTNSWVGVWEGPVHFLFVWVYNQFCHFWLKQVIDGCCSLSRLEVSLNVSPLTHKNFLLLSHPLRTRLRVTLVPSLFNVFQPVTFMSIRLTLTNDRQ